MRTALSNGALRHLHMKAALGAPFSDSHRQHEANGSSVPQPVPAPCHTFITCLAPTALLSESLLGSDTHSRAANVPPSPTFSLRLTAVKFWSHGVEDAVMR
jgi:hypothetical protein